MLRHCSIFCSQEEKKREQKYGTRTCNNEPIDLLYHRRDEQSSKLSQPLRPRHSKQQDKLSTTFSSVFKFVTFSFTHFAHRIRIPFRSQQQKKTHPHTFAPTASKQAWTPFQSPSRFYWSTLFNASTHSKKQTHPQSSSPLPHQQPHHLSPPFTCTMTPSDRSNGFLRIINNRYPRPWS